ncbi:MAG: TIGR01777 family oxidoreductase [Lewinella sp.]|nr:TIGR01777 family oxidoreductase [Lewinella sp.]
MPTILIGGGSGLIGARLSEMLVEKGYEVLHLSRSVKGDERYPTYAWDPAKGEIPDEAIERADYAVNLAGAGIADGLWTKSRKKVIIDSRVDSTHTLINGFKRLGRQPKAFVSAAAMGIYGDQGDAWVKEIDPPGEGFLSESCRAWETAIDQAFQAGWRTAGIRIGMVLSADGGALPKIALPVRFFIGAYFGSGRQYYSWVHIDDLCRLFIHALENEAMNGFYNGVAPNPVTGREMVRQIAQALSRPALMLPIPAFLLRLVLGEMADTVLFSTRVSAEKTLQTGFDFTFSTLDSALRNLLGKQ